MKTPEKIIGAIADYTASMKSDKESLQGVAQIMDYLMFLKRFLELKPYEKVAFGKAMTSGELNDAERAKLNSMTSEEDKSHYISEIARCNYFRRCAWLGYLHGEPRCEKPIAEEPKS